MKGLTGEANRIFWSAFTAEEFSQLCETNILSEKHKKLLYHLQDIQDVPAGEVGIMINTREVDRMIKAAKKKMR